MKFTTYVCDMCNTTRKCYTFTVEHGIDDERGELDICKECMEHELTRIIRDNEEGVRLIFEFLLEHYHRFDGIEKAIEELFADKEKL